MTHVIKNNGVHNYVEHGNLRAIEPRPGGPWVVMRRDTCAYLGQADDVFAALKVGGKLLKRERNVYGADANRTGFWRAAASAPKTEPAT